MKYKNVNPIILYVIAGFLFSNFLFCSREKDNSAVDPSYLAEIQQWHAQRIERLKRPDGWLSLVGLYWLEEGRNTFGSDPSNDIVFPEKAPPFMGVFELKDSTIVVHIQPGVQVLHEGSPVTTLQMQPDVSGHPTRLQYQTLQWYIIKRGERYGVRLKDSESPVLKKFTGIEMFPIDPRWRVKAVFKPYDPPKKIAIPTILGTVVEEPCPGALQFEIDGKTYQLEPVGRPGDNEWFIVFGDQTNGEETYGAGRFLDVPAPDSTGITYIDFNKAYNPPCVFTPYATCPLPPQQNILPIRVTAGEKMWGEGHK